MHVAVSASEAGEQKRLLVLDAEAGWSISEELPLSLGPRNFREDSLGSTEALLEEGQLGPGDRVKCVLPASVDASALDVLREKMEAKGEDGLRKTHVRKVQAGTGIFSHITGNSGVEWNMDPAIDPLLVSIRC